MGKAAEDHSSQDIDCTRSKIERIELLRLGVVSHALEQFALNGSAAGIGHDVTDSSARHARCERVAGKAF